MLGLCLPLTGILTADREITDSGRTTSITRAGAPALVSTSGFAYRTKRPVAGGDAFETGVLAWGRDADALAADYAQAVTDWGAYRAAGGTGPTVDVCPVSAPFEPDPQQRVVDRPAKADRTAYAERRSPTRSSILGGSTPPARIEVIIDRDGAT